MRLSNAVLSFGLILLCAHGRSCRSNLSSSAVEPLNGTSTRDEDIFSANSVNLNSGTSRADSTPSLPVNLRTKYITDEEDYTSNESIAFAIRTRQQRSQAVTVLAGFAYENVNYAFDIENGRLRVILSHEKLPELILLAKNDSERIDDEQWHRLRVERSNRQLRLIVDDIEQANGTLPDAWPAQTNLFIGSELTPVPDGDGEATLTDIIITNTGRSLTLREEDLSEEVFKDLLTPSANNQSEVLQTVAFLPDDNNEIVLPLPINSTFRTLSFSFRVHSNNSTLLHTDAYDLHINSDGYLMLLVRNTTVIEPNPVNDGELHRIHVELRNRTLTVWLDVSRKISAELPSSVLFARDLVLGWRKQLLGCIENISYNEQPLPLINVPVSRQRCMPTDITLKSFHDLYVEQIISFEEYDRPLVVLLDEPEKFTALSFSFYTQESDGVLCSLADRAYDNMLVLTIRRHRLVLTYVSTYHGRIEMSMNSTLGEQVEHEVTLRLSSKETLVLQLNGERLTRKLAEVFYIDTIHMGKLDGFIREQHDDLARDDFVGCMRDIALNDKSLIKLEHIHRSNRLGNTCRLTKRGRKNVVSYMSSAMSFSIRDDHDIIELEIPVNEQFYHCQLSLRTRSSEGTLLSMYSEDDYGFVLFLKHGKLHWKYHSLDDTISEILFEDDRAIDDGLQHDIFISRQISKLSLYKNMYIEIDQRGSQISFPASSLLFFDVLTLGGAHRQRSSQLLVGCYANLTYNHHAVLPEGLVKFDRYDCFYEHDSICDKQISCYQQQPLQFCGQTDCSVVCASATHDDAAGKGLVRYFSDIEPGEYEQIYLTIFTTAGNSTLYVVHNGSIQVSIVLQDYYPRLIIQNGGIIYTYDFPGRVRNDQWHVLQVQKTLNTIDLTFDEETRHYTNFTEHFTLFADNLIHICGGNFNGYIQDIILTADNHYENVVQNAIQQPGLIDYERSVTWNNRANIPEWTPCERIQCLNGGYCIQPATQTSLAYCHCPSQFTGYRCEQAAVVTVDPCVNYQCNHGTCSKDRSNQAYCSCYEGYGGSRCETQIDPCARANCNYGRCEVVRSAPVCRCYQGYTGHECLTTIDACARVSCNYGTCINEGTSYRCECQRGYEGSACDRQVDPCASFVCYNGGVCHVQTNNQPLCQCTFGYRGANCYEAEVIDPCSRVECYGGSCSNDRGVARCVCPIGRAGSRCQDDICTLYPCANSGQCVPEGGTRRCVCLSPYFGDDCREVHRPNPCDNVYCGYGQCREGYCECHGGYSGPRCDVPPDLCIGIVCNYGTCYEGRCTCSEGYTGSFCDTPITTPSPPPLLASTPSRPLLTAQPVGLIGPRKGQLIDYGRLLGARAGPIGWLLAPLAAILLAITALAFAARKCAQGACVPGGGRYIPVTMGTTGGGQRTTRELQLIDQRGDNLATSAGETETMRIEQTREIVREYGGMEATGGVLTSYPTLSSRYGDFAREGQQQEQQQQTSSGFSQQRIIERDYHPPPVVEYNRGGIIEGFRETIESLETSGASGGYSMNAMFADGGLQTDYEMSNINSVSMTPNGKYAIVGQSQGPPQIWDAINGQLVSSMQGTSTNCSKVALACNGTLLVGLAGDPVDPQTSVLQIWDVNTGKPVQLTHQIKCATFTLSNDSTSLAMAGNQKYGRGISVGVLDLNNSELTKEIKSDTNQSYGGTPSFIALTPDERYAVVGCPAGSATNYVVFDLTTPQELVQPATITIDCEPKCSLALNNDQMVTGTRSGQVIIWDIPSCQRIQSLTDSGQSAHRDRITDLKIAPDRSCFVTTSADGTGKVWDTNSKDLISRLIGHKREITCACVSTNQLVATGSKDQTICLWRIQTGQTASTMPVGMTPLDIHMAAHNRTIVAIGDKDGERQLLMLRVVSIQR